MSYEKKAMALMNTNLNGELQNEMINLGIESLEEIRGLEKIISD